MGIWLRTLISFGIFAGLTIESANAPILAQTAQTSDVPFAAGNLQMPLASPAQAEQFLSSRVVPPSDVPAQFPVATASGNTSSGTLQQIDVGPVLGHDLPTDATSGAGFPRADFAVAKPDGQQNKKAVVGGATARLGGPSTAIIHEQPPLLGKP